MRIHLNEIPEEGKSWTCNRNTSELNESLADLIGDSQYDITFTIRPMQAGTYEISGSLQTGYEDDCSRCGDTMPLKISKTFRDLLMPELDEPRNSKYAKSNHVSDLLAGGPEVFNYQGNTFFAEEFFHEKVALEQPLIPCPALDAQGKCSLCHKKISTDAFVYDEPIEATRKSPFAGLKDLKM